LFLKTPNASTYDSGALYPGCDRINNPAACRPIQFATLADGIYYCGLHDEIPVLCDSLAQVDDILAGKATVQPSQILHPATESGGFFDNISTPVLIGAAVLLFVMMSQKGK